MLGKYISAEQGEAMIKASQGIEITESRSFFNDTPFNASQAERLIAAISGETVAEAEKNVFNLMPVNISQGERLIAAVEGDTPDDPEQNVFAGSPFNASQAERLISAFGGESVSPIPNIFNFTRATFSQGERLITAIIEGQHEPSDSSLVGTGTVGLMIVGE